MKPLFSFKIRLGNFEFYIQGIFTFFPPRFREWWKLIWGFHKKLIGQRRVGMALFWGEVIIGIGFPKRITNQDITDLKNDFLI